MTGWPVLEIELLWSVSLFNQDLANTCQIHQNTPITCHHKFQLDECIWKSRLHCIAFRHFPNVTFIRPCLDPSFHLFCISALLFSPHDPILTTPNTEPWHLHLRSCCTPNSGPSGWNSVSGPRPTPGRARDTWLERHDEAHSTHYTAKLQKVSP